MAFWNRKKKETKRTIQIETKSADVMADQLKQFMIFGARKGANNPKICLEMYKESTAISIPVNKISKAFSELTPVLMFGSEKVKSHPLLSLLKRPSPEFSKELLFRSLAVYYLVTGEAFSLYLGNPNSPPKQMYPISPVMCNHMNKNGFINQFDILGEFFPGQFIKNEGMYWDDPEVRALGHIRNFSTRDNSMFRGESLLMAASNAARQQMLGADHNLSVLEKGGHLSLVFHFESDLDDDDFEKVNQRVREKFGGAANAGEIGVTAGGKMSVQDMGMSHKDMDWTSGMKIASEVLLLTYDIPLPLVSMDAATHTNFGDAIELFYDDAVGPLANVIFGGIQNQIGDRFKLPEDAQLTFDEEEVPALKERQIRLVTKRAALDVETDNEIRNMLGRENYVGGDLIYKQSSMIPVGTDVVTDAIDDKADLNGKE